MGSGLSAETDTQAALDDEILFNTLQREYHQMQNQLSDELAFDHMKKICHRAAISNERTRSVISSQRRLPDMHRKKREVLYSKGLDLNELHPTTKQNSTVMSEDTVALLKRALCTMLLSGSQDDALDRVLTVMKPLEVEQNEIIIQQGDSGDKFFVVESGELQVMVNGTTVGIQTAGDHFGELALIYDAPRAATVRAMTNAVLWTLDRDEFRFVQACASNDSLVKRAQWLRQVEILASLSQRQLALLAGVLRAVTFAPNERIIAQGEGGNTFYIVEQGLVSCRQDSTELASFGPGDYFGEMALLSDMPRNASVYAKESVKCLSLGRQEFDTMLGPLVDVLDRNTRIRMLRMLAPFAHQSVETLDEIVSQLEIQSYSNGQCIYRQNEHATAFYIVKTGYIKLTKRHVDAATGQTTTEEILLKSNDMFGEEALKETDELYIGTAVSCGRSQCQRLEQSTYLQRTPRPQEKTESKSCTLQLEDLMMGGVLGEGSFGKVVLVSTRTKERPMALKIMAKSHVLESDLTVQVLREKSTLLSLPPHPFIVSLYATYQDQNNLYMLMELIQGGELFTLFQNEVVMETIDEQAVCFYAANVTLALQHIHAHDYAYRDLKPENLLIDKEGYLKMVDFGFAKKIPFTIMNKAGIEEIHVRTYTLCGTLEYLAPEFILNTGHTQAVDYWALGILIYEMLVGYTPFATGDEDTTQLFRNIALIRTGGYQVDFPFHVLENAPLACDLVKRLLHGDPTKRIGMGINGHQELLQHAWFSHIEWDKLYAKEITPPYIPPLMNDQDLCFFEGEIGHRALDQPFNGDDEWFKDF